MFSSKTNRKAEKDSSPRPAARGTVSFPFLPVFPPKAILLIAALLVGWAASAGPLLASDTYAVSQVGSSTGGGSYVLPPDGSGIPLTFIVAAKNGAVTDGSYTGPASVGFYGSFGSHTLSDPQALIEGKVPIDASASTGTAVVNFTAGVVTIGVILKTGFSPEQLLIKDAANGVSIIYPAGGWSISNPSFKITGYSTQYYFQDANMDSIPATYSAGTTNFDNLILSSATSILTSGVSDVWVTIANSPSVTNANAYAITAVNGGNAGGSAALVPNLYFYKIGGATTPVSIWTILDYGNDPSGPLTDYSNPTTYDGVYGTGAFIGSTDPLNPTLVNTAETKVSGADYALQPFMTNGQVIVRVWAPTAGTTVLMRYQSPNGPASLSSLSVPFSNGNTQPVQASITPGEYFNGAPATLNYIITDNSFAGINFIRFDIPANPGGTGVSWNFTSYPATVPGYPGSTVSLANPNGSTAGGVTLTFSSPNYPAIASPITLALVGTASGATTVWNFGNMAVSAVSGSTTVSEPSNTSGAAVTTLGAPSTPASLTASPANYATSGQQVLLSWPQITDQGANGYIISRRTPAGSGNPFTALVTIGSNSTISYTDPAATNLTSYDYTVVAKNDVVQSGPVTSNAVTAFANPGIPGSVAALTGGTTVQLNWAAPASVSGSYAVTGYQVWRDTQASMASAAVIGTAAASPYNDTTVSAGTTYYYALASLDSLYSSGTPGSAHISGYSVTVSGNPLGNPPSIAATPTLLSSSPATLQLNWTGPANVLNTPLAGYEVSRAVNAGGFAPLTFLASASSPASIYDTAVTPGSYYVYEVQAVDSKGVTSNASNAVTGRVGPPPPGTPTPIASTSGVTLVWPAVTPSGGETVVNYVVYRSSSGIAAPVTTAAASMTYTDSGITAGTDYYYQVAAVDQAGITGGLSGAVTSALLPPTPAALGVSLNLNTDNVAVTWATPSPAEANLQQYYLTQSLNGAAAATIATPANSAVSYLDASITITNAGQTVTYKLSAQNDLAGVGPSSAVSLVVPPNAPAGLAFTASSSAITLNWTGRPASEGVTQYTVYRVSPGPVTAVAGSTASGAVSTLTDSSGSLVEGTNYVYFVKAINTGGAGLGSAPVTAALLLPAPSGIGVSLNLSSDNVAVTWATPSPAEPNLQQYYLTQSLNGAAASTIATPAAGAVSYLDTSITSANAGQTVAYKLYAQNNVGGVGSAASVSLVVPPNAPTGLGFAASSTAVTLNWSAVAGQGVTGYTVYRTTLPSGTPTPIANPSGTAYTDNSGSLAQGVSYAYDVTASNGGGAGLGSAPVTAGLAPLVPTGLNVSSIDVSNDIGVTWTNVMGTVPNATAVSLLSNTLNNSGTASATQLAASAVSFNYAAQAPDTTYYYWLETVNPFGTSALTSAASTLTYPAAVSIVSAALDADGTSRDLTWVTVGGGDVNAYNIYREQLGSGSGFVSVGSALATGLTFPFKRTNPVLPGAVYVYEITAVNATGQGTSQNAVTIGIPPSAPVSVTAVSGVTTAAAVSLNWAEPNALSQGVTSYTVYQATALAGPYTPIAPNLVVTNYLDASVTGTGVYYYVIQANDNNNQSSPVTSANAVAVTAYALPQAPGGLTDTDGNTQINLNWSSAGVMTTYPITGYNIYQSTSAGVTGVVVNATPVPGTSFTAGGLTNGTAYYYSIRAVDSQGHAGPVTGQLNDTPVAPPGIPSNITGSSGNNAVQITWNPGTVGTLPVSFYQIEKIAPGPVTTYIQVPANQNGYVDNGASNGTTYVYEVEAVDGTGVTTGVHVSGYSLPVTASAGLITINPPSQLSATGGVNQVVLKWTDSTGSSLPVTGYQIYHATAAVGPYTVLSTAATVASEPNSYTDSTAVDGTTYYYYLVSNANGTTILSAASATIFATAAAAPTAPTPVSVLDGGQESLNWTASPNQGAVTISQYYIGQTIIGGAGTTFTTTGPVTTYTDNTVSAGQTVVYKVGAVNSNGTTGVLSAAVTGYPYAPMTVTAPSSTDSSSAVILSWTAPSVITWGPVTYDILRTSLTGGSPTTLTTGSTTYTDNSGALVLGQLYVYTITATDTKNHVSVAAGPVTDGPLNPPAAPTTLIATAGNQQILIDWPPSAPVSNSLPVSEYILNYAISGGGSGSVTLPSTQTWYLQPGLSNPTTVSYTVQAVDVTGNPTGNHISSVVSAPATTSTADLNPPTGLAVTATGPGNNLLTWARPNDEGYIVTGYNIYRSGTFTTVLGTPIATIANPALNPVTVYNDGGLSPNTAYYYVITALYQQGPVTVESPQSNHAFDTTSAPVAGVPPVTSGQMAFDANLLKPLTGQVLGIYFVAPNSGPVEIDVYNVSGNPIRALYATSAAGTQENLAWDGKDRNGNTVASGIYLVEIKAPGLHQVKKVLVVK